MSKAFKEFWRSYWDLCMAQMQWTKKHWKGYCLMFIVLWVIVFAPFYIWAKVQEKKDAEELAKNLKDWLNEEEES